ncbi:ATP-binding protein [Geodermatophilus sp. SYSU D00696]
MSTLRTLIHAAADPSLGARRVRELLEAAGSEVGAAFDLVDALPEPHPAPAANGHSPGSGSRWNRPAAAGHVCDVDAVLRTAAAAHTPNSRRITVQSTAALHVAMPRTALMRAVRNLLWNALAATSSNGRILLQAGYTGPAVTGTPGLHGQRRVRVEIHDDGPGPGRAGFHRHGGTGLDVVRSLVLPAGGWLVLGRSPWGGCCAALTLPPGAVEP